MAAPNFDEVAGFAALGALWLAITACEPVASPSTGQAPPPRAEVGGVAAPPQISASASAPAVPHIPPLPRAGEHVPLPVPGFSAAIVAVPRSSATRQPVAVAIHGNYDRPEWQCEEWRGVLGSSGFVLCPRGDARPDSPSSEDIRFTYATNEALERELNAGLDALTTRYAEHVDGAGAILYMGFSLGAIMGVKIAVRSPARYPRLVLVEGGHDAWTPDRARTYAKGGGQRVLFACGQKGCEHAARLAARHLEGAGVAARVVSEPGLGHSYGGALNRHIVANLSWLLEGDARWADGMSR